MKKETRKLSFSGADSVLEGCRQYNSTYSMGCQASAEKRNRVFVHQNRSSFSNKQTFVSFLSLRRVFATYRPEIPRPTIATSHDSWVVCSSVKENKNK